MRAVRLVCLAGVFVKVDFASYEIGDRISAVCAFSFLTAMFAGTFAATAGLFFSHTN